MSDDFERIRWFPLPRDAVTQLQANAIHGGTHVHAHQ